MELYLLINELTIEDFSLDEEEGFRKNSFANFDSFSEFVKQKELFIRDELEQKIMDSFDETINHTLKEKSINTYEIRHWVSNRSFGELIDMFENGEIIKPDMQRNFVWDSSKCSRLIESIILGLPIPPLFLLDVKNNRYELVDGFQRLTALSNYVNGRPWKSTGDSKKGRAAKLSKDVVKELQNKSFSQLDEIHQRKIKRSTIPLIEFNQSYPNNLDSKYLIFERINTGAEKLNSMQIRKALAHGKFISSVYDSIDSIPHYLNWFSQNSIKKDVHIEGFLRIKAMSDVFEKKFTPEKEGISNILNSYCEAKRDEIIEPKFIEIFTEAVHFVNRIFNKNELFRRIEKLQNPESYKYSGALNMSILESFIGCLIIVKINEINVSEDMLRKIKKNYEKIIHKVHIDALDPDNDLDNPFTTSTGTLTSINRRFDLCLEILNDIRI